MIRGIGTDIVEISRIEKSLNNPRFLERNFTTKENEYFNSKKLMQQSVASCFAAKEAFLKAIGTGFSDVSIKDIEVLHNDMGKPYIVIYNRLKDVVGEGRIHLSMSHSQEYATAVVVIEEQEKGR